MSAIKTPSEHQIRERAFTLWQQAGEPEGNHEHFWHEAKRELEEGDGALDEALDESFPASDPPAMTAPKGKARGA